MKTRKIEVFARKHLLPGLPGFEVNRTLVYRRPLLPILRGFAFEDSGFDANALYVWVFVLPLYIPAKHLTFTFGRRLENRKGLFDRSGRWVVDEPPDASEVASMLKAMQTRGIAYLDRLNTPQDIVDHLTLATKLLGNVFVEQAIAFSLARVGNLESAKTKLNSLKRSVKSSDPWQHVGESAEQLARAIDAGPADAAALLEHWTAESLRNLRLTAANGSVNGPAGAQ